ncbi:MAG: SDR family NAD(P)-dependent oxidoreductase, partial [Proteobacteria bacterium]|nr:SDR family NAD(P)-dependent oxidoreductase [Pseudomonadota bacterium]
MNHPLFSLAGQVAIVTGAGKGIGRACALMLARAGADVALTARTQSDLDAVAAEITALGRRAITVAGDISDEATMDALVARTGLDAATLQVRLLELELDGLVARLPG